MLDRSEPGLGHLIERERDRDVGRDGETAAPGFGEAVHVERRGQRVLGDLDEVHAHRLQPVERGEDVGFGPDFEVAGPDRVDALQLGPRGEDRRPEQRAIGHLRSPLQHVVAQVAGRVAHGGDAMGEVQRQQVAVLFDQGRAAAEVDMVVPQARHDEGPGRVDRVRCGVGRGVGGHVDNPSVAHDDVAPGGRGALPDIDDGCGLDHEIRPLARGAAGAGEDDENGDGG